jgi:large subunit ribosomal protein L37Ae
MSKRTKKVGTSGRFGPRYGVTVRKRIADVEAVSKGRHECRYCRAVALGRTASGIWVCRHCGAKMASGTYMPTPPVAVRRDVEEVLAEAEDREQEGESTEEIAGLAELEALAETPKKRKKKE